MKKSIIYLFILLLAINLSSISLKAEQPNLMPSIPGLGAVDENTGLPSSFEKFKAISDNLSETEKSKTYLYQEWTKLFAKNDKLAAVFFYTDAFFSTFNPFWEFIFQIQFSWTWEFIFCLVIWIILIVLIFMPIKDIFFSNQLLNFAITIIVSILVGKSGVIKKAADQLTFAVKNVWLAIFCLILAIMIAIVYAAILSKFGKEIKKQSEEEEIEKSKEVIKKHGEMSEKELKSYKE